MSHFVHEEQLLRIELEASELLSVSILRIYQGDRSYADRSKYLGVCTLICRGDKARLSGLKSDYFDADIRAQFEQIVRRHGCRTCDYERPAGLAGQRRHRTVAL